MPDSDPVDTLQFEPPRADARRGLVTAAVVVLALVAAGVTGFALARGGSDGGQAALAASSGSSAASPSGEAKLRGLHRGRGLLRGGPGMMLGAGGFALHGTFVVPDGSGGYRTMLMQRGKATKVSDTSITVRSADGFEQSYTITTTTRVGAGAAGAAGIAAGHQVAVMAQQKSGSATAVSVLDLTAFAKNGFGPGGMRGGGMMGHPDGDDDDTGTPTGSATQGTGFGV